jgi:hypothetical protein
MKSERIFGKTPTPTFDLPAAAAAGRNPLTRIPTTHPQSAFGGQTGGQKFLGDSYS